MKNEELKELKLRHEKDSEQLRKVNLLLEKRKDIENAIKYLEKASRFTFHAQNNHYDSLQAANFEGKFKTLLEDNTVSVLKALTKEFIIQRLQDRINELNKKFESL